METCFNGQTEEVRLLLKSEMDINCEDEGGNTALIFVIQNEHVEIIELLLSVPGLNLERIDNDGETALGYARWVGNKRIIDLLEATRRK
jgi:ankyrin repeat protein